jgi:predicted hydrocarbon binding protein
MKKPPVTHFYPNRMGRIIFLALEEILGRSGVNAVLNQAGLPQYIDRFPLYNEDLEFPFEYISRIQVALEDTFGPRGGRGVALRAGRACFKYGLREFGPELGLTDLAFRLQPLPVKVNNGCEALAALFNRFTDRPVRLEVDKLHIRWRIERCPLCLGRHTDAASCHLLVGLIQEALYWVSGGKFFQVEETGCIACGDSACTIVIDLEPMS